jgi:3-hydroxyisobutyrate dehydrogenase-like beta-hydroxyacid dehydrogenase
MSDVSVLGTGLMGSALVRALLGAGHTVTLWNRTASSTDALVAAGARRAPSAAEAFAASPLSIVCVRNYAAAWSFIDEDDAQDALAGRSLLQLTTGTPGEARESEAKAKEGSYAYLDGKIMCYPAQIGWADTTINISGSRQAFERYHGLLGALGGQVTFLGEAIGLAATLDAAHLTTFFAQAIGFLYALALCERQGFPSGQFVAQLLEGMPAWLVDVFGRTSSIVQAQNFGEAEATVATLETALDAVTRNFRECGLNEELPALMHALYTRAADAGFAQEDSAALIKLLRR